MMMVCKNTILIENHYQFEELQRIVDRHAPNAAGEKKKKKLKYGNN